MSCGVSMERYDRGEQENVVLKNFRLKKNFLAHPKSPKTQKIKNFKICRVGCLWKGMIEENKKTQFQAQKKFLAHPKSPKTPKIKNFQKTPKKMHIITKPKSVLVVNLSRLFQILLYNL